MTDVDPSRRVVRLVSGGQTGADRAAVDFAITNGIDYGGWVPLGGWAEDYPDPPGVLAAYAGFREAPSPDPDVRTELNVRDSVATLIVEFAGSGLWSPGTQHTMEIAEELGRPLVVVDPSGAAGSAELEVFLGRLGSGLTLNVAGPRESEAPGMYQASRAYLAEVAQLLRS